MQSALVLLEIAALIGFICLLHAFRARLGSGPLYALAGLLEALLFFPSYIVEPVTGQMFFDVAVSVQYSLVLPGLLTILFVIYALDGTRAARRMLVAVVILYVLHGLIDVVSAYHVLHPPDGTANLDHPMIDPLLHQRFASLCAIAADCVALVVVYQFFRNRLPTVPIFVAAYVAFLIAMLVDGVVFPLVYKFDITYRLGILQKLQSGLAAGVPAAAYVWWQLRSEGGVSERMRGTFDIIAMQRQVRDALARLDTLEETFSRYVPPDVVREILNNPGEVELGGEQRDVTVLFADLRSYTTLVENMAADEVISLLNRYLAAVSEPILDCGGMINEIEGDGILAVFGAPLASEDHAERAVAAAIRMRAALEDFNTECRDDGTAAAWQAIGLERLSMRIGIHSGPAIAGNIGTAQRIKYAVVGDTVNTAARVEGLCKTLRTDLLLTRDTLERMAEEARGSFELRDQGEHTVKGRREPVHVFEARSGD